MRDAIRCRTAALAALVIAAALLPAGCRVVDPQVDPVDMTKYQPPAPGDLAAEAQPEPPPLPPRPVAAEPPESAKPTPATPPKAFVGPLRWKSWVRTSINGRYRPLGSIFKGRRVRSNGTVYRHQGVDILAPMGTALVAPADGKVVQAGNWDPDGYGTSLLMEVPGPSGPLYVLYAHLSTLLVRRGEAVTAGDIVARSGKSGNASGMRKKEEHVHVEVRTALEAGRGLAGRVDPLDYFHNVNPPKELK